jgi:hypothetical protein
MTNSVTGSIRFTSCKERKVEAEFGGGEISSDAGAMLLSEADKTIGLCERVASIVDDFRMKNKCKHSFRDLEDMKTSTIISICAKIPCCKQL